MERLGERTHWGSLGKNIKNNWKEECVSNNESGNSKCQKRNTKFEKHF